MKVIHTDEESHSMRGHVKFREVFLASEWNKVSQVVVSDNFILFAVFHCLSHQTREKFLNFWMDKSDFVHFHQSGYEGVNDEHESDESRWLEHLATHFSDFRLFFGKRLRVCVKDAAWHYVGRVFGTNFARVERLPAVVLNSVIDVLRESSENLVDEREQRFYLSFESKTLIGYVNQPYKEHTLFGVNAGVISARFSFHSSPRSINGLRPKIGSTSLSALMKIWD